MSVLSLIVAYPFNINCSALLNDLIMQFFRGTSSVRPHMHNNHVSETLNIEWIYPQVQN